MDRNEVGDLRNLEPPADYEKTFAAALDEFSAGLDHGEKAAAAARGGDVPSLRRELAVLQTKANQANAKARAYGLKVCGAGAA